ncbi:PhnD/SsuA/transferrin family substrate-binding protein [Aestuariirhabdus litorea]|uniref:ABC transporter substrate-binding protein n=1 Tax=Aestuariirhabdus litorea TaxID=2528527 RepID=A0A3P3VJF9_9GAMM|nr:PhnD/SsuA/transferrin family substrate-binding protein [Aestuariirhabdus litorea]RRJ82822.1 ABC transporter substrate-binding protein [Aestuariirhabdus litorea]RWW92981.1 ABC transporter substrate-binding protein [Endozoicomonadaceae bacterium GTF-13]
MLWLLGWSCSALADSAPIRIGLTPVFLDEQLSFLNDWKRYLEAKVGGPVEFIQRQSYREVTELLLAGELDAAWLCGYPYSQHQKRLRLLATPLYQGKPLYQAYLVVPSDDTQTQSLDNLRGKTFAFSDPDSNSGYLVVQSSLREQGRDARSFFRRSFYTWSHRNVVQAVADGLADGGSVDGYVWELLAQSNPDLASKTRVVSRSAHYGFPPFVSLREANPASQRLQTALFEMSLDARGQVLLQRLALDGFERSRPDLYHSIAEMAERL